MPSASYNISTYNQDIDSELTRLRIQLELIWRKEARLLQWHGLQDGMTVLELGCGPGFTTEALLSLLPHSSITAVDCDRATLELAQQHLQTLQFNHRVDFVEAAADCTRLPEASYNFAVARLLFQHLSDPEKTIEEVFRVLKPGGKFAITDVDGDLFWLLDPPTIDTDSISQKIGQAQALQGGNRYIGRQLRRLLQAGGFEALEFDATIASSDELGMDTFLPQIDPNLLLNLVKAGILSQEKLDEIRASREEFLQSPQPLVLMQWFMACGTKPK